MFRVTKKRPKARVVRTFRDDDDDEEEPSTIQAVQKKETKKKRPIARSFEDETEIEHKKTQKSSRKRKKRKGLGFGGSMVPDDEEIELNSSSVYYGKEHLSQLKSEQKYQQPSEATEANPQERRIPDSRHSSLADFIPLNGDKRTEEPVILTGDAALKLDGTHDETDKDHLETVIEEANVFSRSVEESCPPARGLCARAPAPVEKRQEA